MRVVEVMIDLLLATASLSFSFIIDKKICDDGHFECNDSETCVPQRLNCDTKFDCPDGSDEWNCADLPGAKFWDHLFRKRPAAERDEEEHHSDCAWKNFKSICGCRGRDIYCQYKNLTGIPNLRYDDIMLLDLSGNRLINLNKSNVEKIPRVDTLVLRHCSIKRIDRGTFDNGVTVKTLYLDNNEIDEFNEEIFPPINEIQILVLSSNKLKLLKDKIFLNLHKLRELDLRSNLLTEINYATLVPLNDLQILYLNGNRLKTIVDSFPYMKNLKTLSLANNELGDIGVNEFKNLPNLLYLFLSGNRLSILRNGCFNNLNKLIALNLNDNLLEDIEYGTFSPMNNLTSLDLKGNRLRKPPGRDLLKSLRMLDHVYFDEFSMCRAARWVRVCEPKGDGISSLQHLLDNPILRASVWMMAGCACIGNFLVLLGRFLARESNAVHSLYIRNLAFSDLLMGFYLIVIAGADIVYRGRYIDYEESWRHSLTCNLCGFLSTLSCESSALILSLVTWDRFVSVTQPLARRQPSPGRASLHLLGLWLGSVIVAAFPFTRISYFGDEFYGNNGVCLSLHIHDPFAKGWEYSAVMFIILNTLALIFIIYAYYRMLREIKISRVSLRSTQESQERAVAKRFGVIVATDCLCWIPIIAVKIFALTGLRVDEGLYAWLAVLVLPINSALNPVLYTLTTSLFKRQVSGVISAVRIRVYSEHRRRRIRSTIRNGNSESGLSYSLGLVPRRQRSLPSRAPSSVDSKRRLVRNRYNGSSCSKLGSIRSISSVSISSMKLSDRSRKYNSSAAVHRRVDEATPFIVSRLERDRSIQVIVTSPISCNHPIEIETEGKKEEEEEEVINEV